MCEPPGAAGSREEPSAGTGKSALQKKRKKENHAIFATILYVCFLFVHAVLLCLLSCLWPKMIRSVAP